MFVPPTLNSFLSVTGAVLVILSVLTFVIWRIGRRRPQLDGHRVPRSARKQEIEKVELDSLEAEPPDLGPPRDQTPEDGDFLTPEEVKRGWQIRDGDNGLRLKVLTAERRTALGLKMGWPRP